MLSYTNCYIGTFNISMIILKIISFGSIKHIFANSPYERQRGQITLTIFTNYIIPLFIQLLHEFSYFEKSNFYQPPSTITNENIFRLF